MTAIHMVYLDCDSPDCDASTSDDSTPSTASEARAWAHLQGWRLRNGRDLCPSCAAGDGPVYTDGTSKRARYSEGYPR